MQMGRQNRSGNAVILKERLLHTEREREKKEKEKKTAKNTTTRTRNKKQNKTKTTTTKWGTGAVQDKPFDELLMFIVDKDSALFSGL